MKIKKKILTNYHFSDCAALHYCLKKFETSIYDYSIEVLFKSLISQNHLYYVLNGIFYHF